MTSCCDPLLVDRRTLAAVAATAERAEVVGACPLVGVDVVRVALPAGATVAVDGAVFCDLSLGFGWPGTLVLGPAGVSLLLVCCLVVVAPWAVEAAEVGAPVAEAGAAWQLGPGS